MAFVLTIKPGSNVSCGHGALSSVSTTSAAKLRVNGQPVLTRAGVLGKTVTGCSTVASSDASGPVNVTCTLVSKVSAGESTKLKVGGQPVLLDTLKGETNGMVAKVTPQALLAGIALHTKLSAV